MKPELYLTQTAEEQLQTAADWYASNDPQVASDWFHGLIAAMDSIAENPLQFPVARESEHLTVELRQMLYGLGKRKTHRVLFVIRSSTIVVHQIRHVAQDDYSG